MTELKTEGLLFRDQRFKPDEQRLTQCVQALRADSYSLFLVILVLIFTEPGMDFLKRLISYLQV